MYLGEQFFFLQKDKEGGTGSAGYNNKLHNSQSGVRATPASRDTGRPEPASRQQPDPGTGDARRGGPSH